MDALLAESLNKVINVIIIPTDSNHSYLKQGFSKNDCKPKVLPKSIPQFDLPSFGLDPEAPLFIQNCYGPGGLPFHGGNMIINTGRMQRPHSFETKMHCDGVSMLSTDYDTLSKGRRLYGCRSQSMGFLNIEYGRDLA